MYTTRPTLENNPMHSLYARKQEVLWVGLTPGHDRSWSGLYDSASLMT